MKSLSELPINTDGSAYHINLKPEDIVEKIILVGDPGRVSMVSSKFDTIKKKTQNREISTHIGEYKGNPIMVMSTGMGVDNVDICLNELNVLANYNVKTGNPNKQHKRLQIIRVGTCGAFNPDIPLGAHVASSKAIGIDGILYYYDIERIIDTQAVNEFIEKMKWAKKLPHPYIVSASSNLMNRLEAQDNIKTTITVTAPSFYGGQGRMVNLPLAYPDINENLEKITISGEKLGNYEMETSALYGLSAAMNHDALTICLVIAHRFFKVANYNYHEEMDKLIDKTLQVINRK